MVEEKFGSITELYRRVLPALKSKKKELVSSKITFVTEKNIWDYLRETKWCNETKLTLFDIVNDILYVETDQLLDYISKERQEQN